jgi:predicted XRE-type DNA-binding protein
MEAGMNKVNNVIKSSGNVFADLGYEQPSEALAKAKLAWQICELIKEKQLTQAAAAKLLDIDQPKISALRNGRLSGFSTDRLFRFLNALGRDIEVVIRERPTSKDIPWIHVVCA